MSDFPRLGDLTKVTILGRWNGYTDAGYAVVGSATFDPRDKGVTVERQGKPRPHHGDVVLDGAGRVWKYDANEPATTSWRNFHVEYAAEGELPEPLTLLVRDGEAIR